MPEFAVGMTALEQPLGMALSVAQTNADARKNRAVEG